MKRKWMISGVLALCFVCALILSSTNIIATIKYRDDGYELIDIEPINLSEGPKPSDTTVTVNTQPTDTTESVDLDIPDTSDSVRPKTMGISAVKIPKTAGDLELFACVLMLLISCLYVMMMTAHDEGNLNRREREKPFRHRKKCDSTDSQRDSVNIGADVGSRG